MMKASRWALITVVAVMALGLGNPIYGKTLKFEVHADFNTFQMIEFSEGSGNGPFYVRGTIFKTGTDTVIGSFQCSGTFFSGGALAVVSQEYHFFGRGKITVSGIEDEGRRAITGGTKTFKHITGQVRSFDLSEFNDTGVFTGRFQYKD